ncbi:MAG TPA: redoxin family protein [Wenzhouxiangella sp.]|nr:redoxin family protein [Wenzhouxiangella sp.]
MTGWRLWVSVVIFGVLAGAGLAWFTNSQTRQADRPVAGISEGDFQPGFELANMNGEPVSDGDFAGRAMLVNFWATWCAPCRREMPLLAAVSKKHEHELAVIGIAMDDAGRVREFVDELGIDYTILVGMNDVLETQRAWGNSAGALPYTVLVDSEGKIRWLHLGEVGEDQLDAELRAVVGN